MARLLRLGEPAKAQFAQQAKAAAPKLCSNAGIRFHLIVLARNLNLSIGSSLE
jgi:hypothetical protein